MLQIDGERKGFAWRKYLYCLAAGCWSAGGSFFGKLPNFLLASNVEVALPAATAAKSSIVFQSIAKLNDILYQLVCFLLMVLCNLCNWRYVLKAMQSCDDTLTPIALTTAINYIMSFILAKSIYGEEFTSLSLFGLVMILFGLWLLCGETNVKTIISHNQHKKKKHNN